MDQRVGSSDRPTSGGASRPARRPARPPSSPLTPCAPYQSSRTLRPARSRPARAQPRRGHDSEAAHLRHAARGAPESAKQQPRPTLGLFRPAGQSAPRGRAHEPSVLPATRPTRAARMRARPRATVGGWGAPARWVEQPRDPDPAARAAQRLRGPGSSDPGLASRAPKAHAASGIVRGGGASLFLARRRSRSEPADVTCARPARETARRARLPLWLRGRPIDGHASHPSLLCDISAHLSALLPDVRPLPHLYALLGLQVVF
jgi:hypothetical protein